MREIKITDEMHESPHLKGFRKFIFWNDDENGKPIDKEWFRYCYEQIEKAHAKERAVLKKHGLL